MYCNLRLDPSKVFIILPRVEIADRVVCQSGNKE